MSKDSVARVGKDTGSKSTFTAGSTTVIVNDAKTVFLTSTNAVGASVVTTSKTVFIEDKGIARESDIMSDGGIVDTGSTTVFAGK